MTIIECEYTVMVYFFFQNMVFNSSLDSGLDQFKYHDFVAFTSTFYKDDVEWRVRSEAFFEMIENAQKLGIHVVVGDGGSGNDFRERVSTYSNVTLLNSGKWWQNSDLTMAGERRFSGKKAMELFPNVSYFLWLEPEKAELMKMENIDAILSPLRDETADIVVPSRISKETLPAQQRAAENRANVRALDIVKNSEMRNINDFKKQWIWVWFDFNYRVSVYHDPYDWTKESYTEWWLDTIIGKSYEEAKWLDLWFGPKAFTRKSMQEDFLSYTWAKWDGIITSVLAWKQRGKSVLDVPVDFTYPRAQTELESWEEAQKNQEKRRIQYRYIIKTIRDMVRYTSHPDSIMSSVWKHIQSHNFDALIRLTNSFPLTHGHQDSRRLIEEYNGVNFSVQRFTVFDNKVWLGNHYHRKWEQDLSEVFMIEAGQGTLILKNLEEFWTPSSEQEVMNIKKWDIIVIPPYQAHTFFLEVGSIMRWFRPYPFDPDNMDMNSYRLELPER